MPEIPKKNDIIEKYKNLYLEMKNKVDKMTLEIKQKLENNNTTHNNTVNDKTEKTLNEKDTEMSSLENEYREIVKENANLKNKLNLLNEEIEQVSSNDSETKIKEIVKENVSRFNKKKIYFKNEDNKLIVQKVIKIQE